MDDITEVSLPNLSDAYASTDGHEGTVDSQFQLACLPNELLLHIFSFLDSNERLSVARVCRTWRCLILTSPRLWDKQQLKLKCSRQSHQSRRSCFYTKRLGHFLRKLTINCEHPSNHQCKYMAVCFQKLIKNLKSKSPALTSFKVIDLRLAGTTQAVITQICPLLSCLLETLTHLKSFQMSSAQWPPEEGKAVIATLLKVSKNTLETLQIDGFFVSQCMPMELDQFAGIVMTLTRLTKLAIDYSYLTSESVIILADTKKGQMKKLKLITCDISPNTHFISKYAWQYLTTSCPAMRVEFCIKGFVIHPSRSIPAILDPALRISMINLLICGVFNIAIARLCMTTVFDHIMNHFRNSLVRFEINSPYYYDCDDAAFINMVRQCKHLTHVEVTSVFYNDGIHKLVAEITKERKNQQEEATRKRRRDRWTSLAVPTGTTSDAATADHADYGSTCGLYRNISVGGEYSASTSSPGVSNDGNPMSKKSKFAAE